MSDEQSKQEPVTRPRGRPKAAEPLVPVTTWVTRRKYEALRVRANRHDLDISPYLRSLLDRVVP